MAEEKIDRRAWSDLVSALIAEVAGGNKAAFARLVGVDPRTVTRWQSAIVDVSEESVRDVARALRRSPIELLLAVGYYLPSDLPRVEHPPPPAAVSAEAEEAEIANNPTLEPQMKVQIIKFMRERRERERQQRIEDARRMVELAGGKPPDVD